MAQLAIGDKVTVQTAKAGGYGGTDGFEKVKGGLKSNIEMVVASISEGMARCVWTINNIGHSQEFPVSLLVKK